jgi:hypothetical protein
MPQKINTLNYLKTQTIKILKISKLIIFEKQLEKKKCKYNITEWKNILKTEIDNMKIESWTIYTIFQWVVENLLFKVRKLMKI